jgi:methionyl-tRNA formyltransferase
MKIVLIGCVDFSARCLEALIRLEANIVGVCTLQESPINSDHVDLTPIAKKYEIPVSNTVDINSPLSITWIKELEPDIIFCFGWSRLLGKDLLKISPMGVVGFHPAALPANRGRHPLIWALVLGLDETASTFFVMDEEADSGDILSQRTVSIEFDDDASSLYDRVTRVAISQIEDFLPLLAERVFSLSAQDHSLANNWRKRGACDGTIDWRMSAKSIYNLVRGLSYPYVGAHFGYKSSDIKVWKCKIVKGIPVNIEPGKIVGLGESGPIIKVGEDAIELVSWDPKIKFKVKGYL